MNTNRFTWFALDNIDFLEDTASGKNTLHGTGIVMYQNECTEDIKTPLVLKRPPNRDTDRVEMPVQYCKRIDIKPKKKLDFKLTESCNLDI